MRGEDDSAAYTGLIRAGLRVTLCTRKTYAYLGTKVIAQTHFDWAQYKALENVKLFEVLEYLKVESERSRENDEILDAINDGYNTSSSEWDEDGIHRGSYSRASRRQAPVDMDRQRVVPVARAPWDLARADASTSDK